MRDAQSNEVAACYLQIRIDEESLRGHVEPALMQVETVWVWCWLTWNAMRRTTAQQPWTWFAFRSGSTARRGRSIKRRQHSSALFSTSQLGWRHNILSAP